MTCGSAAQWISAFPVAGGGSGLTADGSRYIHAHGMDTSRSAQTIEGRLQRGRRNLARMSGSSAVVFAGVTAACELTMRGRCAVLVAARDRLGGRTYTADHDGRAMELGGTGGAPVLQPNLGAEISRYGMEAETLPVLWGGRPHVRGRR